MMYAAFALFCSALVTFMVVRFVDLHSHFSADHDVSGVQKAHVVPVPRVGGLGIFAGLCSMGVLLWIAGSQYVHFYLLFLVPSSLVFAIGLLEDLTKRVSVSTRLIVIMFAALVGAQLFNAITRSFDVPAINALFQINLIALLFTVIAVAGVANSVNLIDGFNGLSSTICIMALLAIGIVAYKVEDQLILTIALATAGAIAGFLIWNYPRAKIFLGDGGAYLIGFVIAELAILINERHRSVPALFPLLVMIYPIFETLFSIYRRKFVRGQSPGAPDAMHLHQMINKRVVRWRVGNRRAPIRARGNAMTSPFLWIINLLAVVPAVAFYDHPPILAAFIFLFVVFYTWLYRRIARFRTPRLLGLLLPGRVSRSSYRGVVAITSNTSWSIYNFRQSLIRALQAEGFRVLIFSPVDDYTSRLAEAGYEHYDVKIHRSGINPIEDLRTAWCYWRLLWKHKPDVLLTYTPKPNIYGAIAACLAGVPVITNISGLGRAFISKNWITSLVKCLYRVALQSPVKVYFQNKDDRAAFLELDLVDEEKVALLPGSGIDTRKYIPIDAIKQPDRFVFTMVARMLRDKGVGEFVDAARIVKRSHPRAVFRLVGFMDAGNPSAITAAEMSTWVNEGVVEYSGPTDDVRSAFSMSDCVVLPSYREGTPRTLLEAASMALPIITTDAPGCRDTVDDGISGYLCQVKDSKGLAACMLQMMELPEFSRRQMGLAGRRKMERQYDETIVLNAYRTAILDVTEDGTAQAGAYFTLANTEQA